MATWRRVHTTRGGRYPSPLTPPTPGLRQNSDMADLASYGAGAALLWRGLCAPSGRFTRQTCRHAEMQTCRRADMQICRPKVKSVILVPGRPAEFGLVIVKLED